MATQAPDTKRRQTERVRSDGTHESFMQHNNYQWLKIGSIIALICVIGYALIDVQQIGRAHV